MVAIVDYGAGNLHSVENALAHIGQEFRTTADSSDIDKAKRVILPGVGNFGQMMAAIDRLDLRDSLRNAATDGRPFLGVCLGMQAMLESSEEAPAARGLGMVPGTVCKFQVELAVPQMGWNMVESSDALVPSGWYTFANSFYVAHSESTIVTSEYEIPFSAAIRVGNAIGVQFHPEKSGALGLQLLKNFCEMNPC